MFSKLLSWLIGRRPEFPTELIVLMGGLTKDDHATKNVELISGVPFWSDEGFDEIVQRSMRVGSDRWREPFLHRLFLLTGEKLEGVDYPRCEATWNYLKEKCPSWPGFYQERSDPSRGPEILRLIEETYQEL